MKNLFLLLIFTIFVNGCAYKTKRTDNLIRVDKSIEYAWQKTFGGPGNEEAFSMAKTDDGFVVVGITPDYNKMSGPIYLIRLDNHGNIIWQKTFDTYVSKRGLSIINTGSGYIIAGSTKSTEKGDYDFCIIKLDKQGNEIWQKIIGTDNDDSAKSIIKADAGYIIVGDTKISTQTNEFRLLPRDSESFVSSYVYVTKIDENGKLIWDKSFGGSNDDRAHSIVKADGGYIIAGDTKSFGGANGRGGLTLDAYLIKIDENGTEIWQKYVGGALHDSAKEIIKADGGYIIAGSTNSYGGQGFDVYVVKLDKNGNEIWRKNFGGFDHDSATSIIATDDGYFVTGSTYTFSNGMGDVYLIKLDKNGNKIWQKNFGGKGLDYARSIIKVENGYVIAGSTDSFGNRYNFYIIKLNKKGAKF